MLTYMVWRKLNSLLSRRSPGYGNRGTFRCSPSFRKCGGHPCVTAHLRLETELCISVWRGPYYCSRIGLPPVPSAGPRFAGGLSEPCLPPSSLFLKVACQQVLRLLCLFASVHLFYFFFLFHFPPFLFLSFYFSLTFEKLWLNIHSISVTVLTIFKYTVQRH